MSKNAMHASPESDVILDDGLTPHATKWAGCISSRAASIRLALCPSCPSSIGPPPQAKAGPIMGPFSLHAATAAAIPASALPFLPSFPSYGAKLPRSFSFTFSSQGLLPFPPFLPPHASVALAQFAKPPPMSHIFAVFCVLRSMSISEK